MAEPHDPTRATSAAKLDELERDLDRRLIRIQTPQHERAVDRLFAMSSEELGQAAVDAAHSRE